MSRRGPDTDGAVSRQIEDFVRSIYERFNSGERVPDADTWHADAQYVTSREDPDFAIHSGLDAVRKQFKRWVDTYPDLRVEPVELLVNGDRVFVWASWSGHPSGSGAPITMTMAQVVTVDGAKVKRVEEYFDRDEALRALGQ